MKKTTLIIVLMLGLGCSMNMYAQVCKQIIFPGCGNENRLIPESTLTLNSTCNSVQIIDPPEYGTLTIDPLGNVIDTTRGVGFLYEPGTNCITNLTDTFEIEIYDDTNSLCESVTYILEFITDCERPDDIFCCIPPDKPSFINVLTNDSTFIETIYSGSTYTIEDTVILPPDLEGRLIPPFNNPYTYSPDPGFTGLDSFSYEVIYTIITVDGDTITICDKPTCYIQVDDCLHTMSDAACTMKGDTVCIDPIANDRVTIVLDDPVLDSIGCTNPEPMIDPTTLTMPQPIDGGPVPWEDSNGNWCFTGTLAGTLAGTYTYTYDICTDAGGCATDSIVITVNDGIPCPCNSTLSINNTYNNGDNEYIEVTESIFSTATINTGADVTFDAGNFILLEDVFLADKGAVFLAKIDGCDNVPEIQIKGDESNIISVFKNYPNPFTGQTTIEFTITKDAPVTLLVFDSIGRKVATLLDTAPSPTGTHQVIFEGTGHSSGVYYYTIRAGEFFGTQKMILVK